MIYELKHKHTCSVRIPGVSAHEHEPCFSFCFAELFCTRFCCNSADCASCRVKTVHFLTFPVFSTVCVESRLEEGFQQRKIAENELDEKIFCGGLFSQLEASLSRGFIVSSSSESDACNASPLENRCESENQVKSRNVPIILAS